MEIVIPLASLIVCVCCCVVILGVVIVKALRRLKRIENIIRTVGSGQRELRDTVSRLLYNNDMSITITSTTTTEDYSRRSLHSQLWLLYETTTGRKNKLLENKYIAT